MRKECQTLGRGGFEVLLGMGGPGRRCQLRKGASMENVESGHEKILPTPPPCFIFALFSPAFEIATLIYSLLCARPQVYHSKFIKQSWEVAFPHF